MAQMSTYIHKATINTNIYMYILHTRKQAKTHFNVLNRDKILRKECEGFRGIYIYCNTEGVLYCILYTGHTYRGGKRKFLDRTFRL